MFLKYHQLSPLVKRKFNATRDSFHASGAIDIARYIRYVILRKKPFLNLQWVNIR